MKKVIGLTIFVLGICISAQAQEKIKAKPTITKGDAVHNIFHPRHRRHSAYKYKHAVGHHKRKVFVKPGKAEMKNN